MFWRDKPQRSQCGCGWVCVNGRVCPVDCHVNFVWHLSPQSSCSQTTPDAVCWVFFLFFEGVGVIVWPLCCKKDEWPPLWEIVGEAFTQSNNAGEWAGCWCKQRFYSHFLPCLLLFESVLVGREPVISSIRLWTAFFCLHTHMTAAPTAPVIKATQVLTFSSHQCRCSTPAAAAFSRHCLAVSLDLVHCNTAKWVKGWTGSPNLMLTPCPWILYLLIGPSRGLAGRK